jgi:membrane protease YdiL (CAAX protease family)
MFLRIFLLVTFLGGGQEEVGWRSYALDRLQARFSALLSSLILGTFWAVWHLPLWFMPGTSQPVTPFGAFLLMCLSLSVILTWIYNNTGRNMVAVILTHGMVNASHPLLPVINPGSPDQHVYVFWAFTIAATAAVITLVWGPATLTRRKGIQRPVPPEVITET